MNVNNPYMIQKTIQEGRIEGSDLTTLNTLTDGRVVGGAFLRNGYSYVTGINFITGMPITYASDEMDNSMGEGTRIEVTNKRGDVTNGFINIRTDMFEQLCISFLKTRGYSQAYKIDGDKADYVHGGGYSCPVCEVDDQMEGNGVIAVDEDGYASQQVLCNKCEASWTDVYKLVDIENLEVTDGQK